MATWDNQRIYVTSSGQTLVNRVASGNGKIAITRVTSSSAFLEGVLPVNAKALQNEMQDFITWDWDSAPDGSNSYVLEAQLDNTVLLKDGTENTNGYQLKQIGIFAKFVDEDGTEEESEVLLFFAEPEHNDTDPDLIPAKDHPVIVTYALQVNMFTDLEGKVTVNVDMRNAGVLTKAQYLEYLNGDLNKLRTTAKDNYSGAINELKTKVDWVDDRTAGLISTVNKAFKWKGWFPEDDKDLDTYHTIDHVGFWNAQSSSSTPSNLPISRVSNEILTICIWGTPSTDVTQGFTQEVFYTKQNRRFVRYYSGTWSEWGEVYSGNTVAGFDVDTYFRYKGDWSSSWPLDDVTLSNTDMSKMGIWRIYSSATTPSGMPLNRTSNESIYLWITGGEGRLVETLYYTKQDMVYSRYKYDDTVWTEWKYDVRLSASERPLISSSSTSFTGEKIPVVSSTRRVTESNINTDEINVQNGKGQLLPSSSLFYYTPSGLKFSGEFDERGQRLVSLMDENFDFDMCAICCWNGVSSILNHHETNDIKHIYGQQVPPNPMDGEPALSYTDFNYLVLANLGTDTTRYLKSSSEIIPSISREGNCNSVYSINNMTTFIKGLPEDTSVNYELCICLSSKLYTSNVGMLNLFGGRMQLRYSGISIGLLVYNNNRTSQLLNQLIPIGSSTQGTVAKFGRISYDTGDIVYYLKVGSIEAKWTQSYDITAHYAEEHTLTLPRTTEFFGLSECIVSFTSSAIEDDWDFPYAFALEEGIYASRGISRFVPNEGVLSRLTIDWYNSLTKGASIAVGEATLTGNEPEGTVQYVVKKRNTPESL